MLSVLLGLAYANAFEWFVHKYLLHGLGKRRESFWSFHWHDHHQAARKNDMYDAQYVRSLFTWSPQAKEALSVIGAALLHAPLFFVAPFFAATLVVHAAVYYGVHRRAHLDTAWCKRYLPWHSDHHMGRDQNANWCATQPWFDLVMGTRKKYRYDDTGKVLAEDARAPAAAVSPR